MNTARTNHFGRRLISLLLAVMLIASLCVSGIGSFSAVTVNKADSTVTTAPTANELTYTGKAQKVTVTVTDAAGNKVDATAANLTIKGNSMTKPGKQTVTVTDAAGNKLTATLKMVPKKVTGVKVANVKGAKAKISFTKAVGATKYQVKYTVAGASAKSTKITKNAVTVKVTKGKKVTAQVRAYSKGGWGAWSAKKAFTTDKK